MLLGLDKRLARAESGLPGMQGKLQEARPEGVPEGDGAGLEADAGTRGAKANLTGEHGC